MHPNNMEFYSDAQNKQMSGMRGSNFIRENFQQGGNLNLSHNGFINKGNEIDDGYPQRSVNNRTEAMRTQTQFGQKQRINMRRFAGKNSSLSMHNLNNFGYLKESGSIQVQNKGKRPSIFR